jgi:hypothetical protein
MKTPDRREEKGFYLCIMIIVLSFAVLLANFHLYYENRDGYWALWCVFFIFTSFVLAARASEKSKQKKPGE